MPRWLNRVEEGLAALVLAGMVSLAFVNMLTRYLLHYSPDFHTRLYPRCQ